MTNYFELYGIPVSFSPDADAVKHKYDELSGRHLAEGQEYISGMTLEQSLVRSAKINGAYKTLKDNDATMGHVLQVQGFLEEGEQYSLQPDFMLEMMELEELVTEAELDQADEDSREQAIESMQNHLQAWEEEVRELTQRFEAGERSEALMHEIKEYYFRKKYLLGIQQRITKFATPERGA